MKAVKQTFAGAVLIGIVALGSIGITIGLLAPTAPSAQAAPIYPPRNGDPCQINVRSTAILNQTASAQVIAGVTGKFTYLCHSSFVTQGAQNVALVEGTGSVCATNVAGMAGGATAAAGWGFAANTGLTQGTGSAWVMASQTAGDNVCLLQSSTGQISGVIDYVQM